ncbi:MAG: dihydroorotate dehydrogenase-like protein [Bacteroidetes bacterium]|nr:dihydroorotate dehydrogenase-like protein [Bacteroidota bacterium]
MPDLSVNYLNLKLKNPVIAASSGQTKTLDNLVKLQDNGIGAVVLKSFFEESLPKSQKLDPAENYHPEIYEYFGYEHDKYFGLKDYCELVSTAKSKLSVPVIASINCVSADWWFRFSEQLEAAGADAIELNVFNYASSKNFASPNIEKIYLDIVKGVKNTVKIPVAIKIGQNFSSLPNFVSSLERNGVNGIVLFNRFTDLDIDINTFKFKTTFEFSDRHEFFVPLRWIAILYRQVKCSLSASTGAKSHEEIIKFLLAGASTVQLASVIYQKGPSVVSEILKNIEKWMGEHNIDKLDSLKGKLSFSQDAEGIANYYMRSQFMEKITKVE